MVVKLSLLFGASNSLLSTGQILCNGGGAAALVSHFMQYTKSPTFTIHSCLVFWYFPSLCVWLCKRVCDCRNGTCQTPQSSVGAHQVKNSRLYIRFNSAHFLRGSFWVVDTDYSGYALVYGCSRVKSDHTCHTHHQLVYIISRTDQLTTDTLHRLQKTVRDRLCVNPSRLVYTTHTGRYNGA